MQRRLGARGVASGRARAAPCAEAAAEVLARARRARLRSQQSGGCRGEWPEVGPAAERGRRWSTLLRRPFGGGRRAGASQQGGAQPRTGRRNPSQQKRQVPGHPASRIQLEMCTFSCALEGLPCYPCCCFLSFFFNSQKFDPPVLTKSQEGRGTSHQTRLPSLLRTGFEQCQGWGIHSLSLL